MLTVVFVATAKVFTVKVTDVPPPATVTLAATCATTVLLLDRRTTRPPVGAAPLNVTVPVDGLPPSTVVGLSVTDETAGGFTVNGAD
jgi:hypothetical protein